MNIATIPFNLKFVSLRRIMEEESPNGPPPAGPTPEAEGVRDHEDGGSHPPKKKIVKRRKTVSSGLAKDKTKKKKKIPKDTSDLPDPEQHDANGTADTVQSEAGLTDNSTATPAQESKQKDVATNRVPFASIQETSDFFLMANSNHCNRHLLPCRQVSKPLRSSIQTLSSNHAKHFH